MTLANAHALFVGLKADPSFLANLTIVENERAALMSARQRIRSALRAASLSLALTDAYWQDIYVRKFAARTRERIEVKFMTQGSFAYGTLNEPAQKPYQEIDLDDGMYVPVDFLDNGEPALTAKGLFRFVETAVTPLCVEMGWKLDDKYHENCVRVKLWTGAHIDIPIYSIPRDRYEAITETLEKAFASHMARDSMTAHWKLPSDQIMLAQRSGSWVQSDPQQLHDWVKGRIERYGPIFRRLSRFFKGWRDHTWVKPELSSLCVMCGIDEALRDLDGFPTENRDDELIMNVAKRLPAIFSGKVLNPVLQHLCLNSWTDDTRDDIVRATKELSDHMTAALERTGDAEEVVKKLRGRFGTRVPYRPDAVKIASKIEAIQRATPATVPSPKIIPSTSG